MFCEDAEMKVLQLDWHTACTIISLAQLKNRSCDRLGSLACVGHGVRVRGIALGLESGCGPLLGLGLRFKLVEVSGSGVEFRLGVFGVLR